LPYQGTVEVAFFSQIQVIEKSGAYVHTFSENSKIDV